MFEPRKAHARDGPHHLTDPSGFNPNTVSTAADQLRVFQQAMRLRAFRQTVSIASVTLPVAGTLTNYNPLITDGYAGKTGSDSGAEGCLAFFTHVTLAGRLGGECATLVRSDSEGNPRARPSSERPLAAKAA